MKQIITPYYELAENNHTISLLWKNESSSIFYYSKKQKNYIYKVSDTEVLYSIDNKLWYNNYEIKHPKMIIKSIKGTCSYSELYRKIILYMDISDPPDTLLIISLDDIINEPILNLYEDERTSFETGKFFIKYISSWSNDFYANDKYVYIIEEESEKISKIDILTRNITTSSFEHKYNDNITYNYTFGKEVDDGIIINLTDSDAPNDDEILDTIKITFD